MDKKKSLRETRSTAFARLFDKVTFGHVFLIWIFSMIIFATVYFILSLSTEHGVLMYGNRVEASIIGFFDTLYFSFITSTSLGYGDVIPTGISRIIASMEVVLGLIMYGILISKLVGVKQEIMLEEIYDISFEENINRLRSGLFLIRGDLSKYIDKINKVSLTTKELRELWVHTGNFNNTLRDITDLLCSKKKYLFFKKLDNFRLELILNSIDMTASRLLELIEALESHNLDYKNRMLHESIERIIKHVERIINSYEKNQDERIVERITELEKITKNLGKIKF